MLEPLPRLLLSVGVFFYRYEANILVQILPCQLDDGPNITATCRSSGRIPTPLLRVLERRM